MYNTQRGKEERRQRGSHREMFHVQSAGVFILFAPSSPFLSVLLLLSLFTPELKMLERPESHRGVIRVCCSPSNLPSLSSLSPPLRANHTVEGRSSLALCSGVGLCSKPL